MHCEIHDLPKVSLVYSILWCLCLGACMAVGLKYAGTADSLARATLHFFVVRFLKLKKDIPEKMDDTDAHHDHIDKQALETVLNVCALSLSAVMAGTGETTKLMNLCLIFLWQNVSASVRHFCHHM